MHVRIKEKKLLEQKQIQDKIDKKQQYEQDKQDMKMILI